jgi:hypothetical protein
MYILPQVSARYSEREQAETHSMRTNAAIASTMGIARGTTQGSCRPLAARTPDDPSYLAVGCSIAIVAGGLNPILRFLSADAIKEHWPCSPEVNVLSVCNTTLNTTTPVRLGPECLLLSDGMYTFDKHVIVLRTWERRSSEARTDLEGLCGRDREHGMCKDSFEFVEYGFTETQGGVSDDTCYRSPKGVVSGFRSSDRL